MGVGGRRVRAATTRSTVTPSYAVLRSAGLLALFVLGGAHAAAAQTPTPVPALLKIDTVPALAGTDVEVPVSLDPGPQSVFFLRNDIETGLLTPVRRVSPNGPVDCTANAQLGFTSATFTCLTGTSTICTRVRAILTREGGDPLPADTLYTCTYSVDPTAMVGSYLLNALGVILQDGTFQAVPSSRQNGAIQVVLVLPPTPTATDTRTPTLTPTPSLTPSVTATVTIGNSPTATNTRTATPTQPTGTATITLTSTLTLTPTRTRTRTPTRTPLPFASPTATNPGASNTAPLLTIGNALGVPGNELTISVTLDPGDQTVIGAQNGIVFDTFLHPVVLSGNQPDCEVNPGLTGLASPAFICANPACTTITATVFKQLGAGSFTATLLYTCHVLVDANAPVDTTQGLIMQNATAYGPAGNPLATSDNDGVVLIVASLPPTATLTPTRTPTNTRTASITPTETPTGPTHTATQTGTATSTGTRTITPTPLSTSTITVTRTVTITRTPSSTRTATATRSTTPTASPSASRTGTRTVTSTRTETPTFTPTITGSIPPSSTRTETPTQTPTGTAADTATRTPSRTLFPTRTATETRTATPSRTPVHTRTATPSGSVTRTATASRTPTTSNTANATVTATATINEPTATPTGLDTPTATATPEATSTHSPTQTAQPSPTPTIPSCEGDCGGDDMVTIDELLLAVNIALGRRPVSACTAVDRNGSGEVTIDELIAAVSNALEGCPL